MLSNNNKTKNLRLLRPVGILEGISYLSLFGITMPLKYIYDILLPNYIVGLLHGFLFILYCILTFIVFRQYELSTGKAALLFVASLLPFGTFVTDKKILAPLEVAGSN
jgi:integral membrane protein